MKNLKVTLSIVVLVGLGLWGTMLKLTYGVTSPNDLLIHLGETGATLAILTVLGALVRQVFLDRDKGEDRRDQERHEKRQKDEARLEFIRNLLADFKSVYDRVESCRLLVEAHRSAKTYGEQMRQLVGGVVTLHNIKRALDPEFPNLKEELREPIREMTKFVKNLLEEFRDNYREISKLQEADEAWNKYQRETLPAQDEPPSKYTPVSRAWKTIEKLPRLSALRDDDRFEEYESGFLVYLDAASATLRSLLPVGNIVIGDGTQSPSRNE
ncbi:MAG: hypothetical protein OER97_05655 [Gammaproteobacteria bacterium]|nr:hypothetical protein [Gammaproteobacteria bacterium]